MRRGLAMLVCALAAGCSPTPPPPDLAFEGLPVNGDQAFAERLGFAPCFPTSNAIRCRREGVMLFGKGPFRGAVDLKEGKGSGFYELTLWHHGDQRAVLALKPVLEANGWQLCRTGQEDRGDQEIWTRPGSKVRFSVDISYWGKRRFRILREHGQPTGHCF